MGITCQVMTYDKNLRACYGSVSFLPSYEKWNKKTKKVNISWSILNSLSQKQFQRD